MTKKWWVYWLIIPRTEPAPVLWWMAMSEWLRYRNTEFGLLRLWVRRKQCWICRPYNGTRWYLDWIRPSRGLIRRAPDDW